MLNQHLAHIGGGDAGVNRLLRVFQEGQGGGVELRVGGFGAFDHAAQCGEHRRQIGLELRDRFAEFGDLRPLVREKQVEQLFQPVRVIDRAAGDLLSILEQNRFVRILEDDVVLRIAAAEFLLDFRVEVVLFVFRLPKTERHSQFMEQRAIDEAAVFRRRVQPVFGNENQVLRPPPILKKGFKRLPDDGLAHLARYAP
jgi:hypothetical protein